jgi:hypothetical protein
LPRGDGSTVGRYGWGNRLAPWGERREILEGGVVDGHSGERTCAARASSAFCVCGGIGIRCWLLVAYCSCLVHGGVEDYVGEEWGKESCLS